MARHLIAWLLPAVFFAEARWKSPYVWCWKSRGWISDHTWDFLEMSAKQHVLFRLEKGSQAVQLILEFFCGLSTIYMWNKSHALEFLSKKVNFMFMFELLHSSHLEISKLVWYTMLIYLFSRLMLHRQREVFYSDKLFSTQKTSISTEWIDSRPYVMKQFHKTGVYLDFSQSKAFSQFNRCSLIRATIEGWKGTKSLVLFPYSCFNITVSLGCS